MADHYGVTYAYYSLCHTTADETTFKRLLPLVVAKVDTFTHRRARALPDGSYKLVQVRDTLCILIDHMAVQEQTQQGYGIQSVSNEGYSESYQASTPEKVNANLRSVCAAALSGTGLMGAL